MNHHRRARRAITASAAAAAILGAAFAVAPAAMAGAAEDTSAPCLANPMAAATPIGSASGYTIFVTGDAILANSELEGSLAVGGTATFGDPRGLASNQYPLYHGGIGGNADYTPPTIDGEYNRLLINRFGVNPDATKVVQIKAPSGGAPVAGAKIVDRATPAGYTFGPQFGGAGTTYFPAAGTNMSAQIESEVQAWNGGAGAATFATAQASFSSYFPADEGSDLLAQTGIWRTPTIIPGGDTTVTLDPSGPNRVPLSAISGAPKFRLDGYSTTSPLIVKVAPSDVVNGVLTLPSEVNAGKNAPGNAALSYILWDLSDLTGDVTITSYNEPVRGSIYAPDAHVVFPTEAQGGREFEGQLIAGDLTVLSNGKELHTNLFKGELPCASDSTTDPGTGEPGTTGPTDPGTTEPGEPGTTDPGTTEPGEPGTTEPGEPGTTEPGEPGTTEPGTTEPGEPGTTEPGTTEPGEPGTTEEPVTDDTTTQPTAEQPAATSSDSLAITGGGLPWIAGGTAAALAAAGGILLLVSRRKRSA
ncbi:collagen-binding domain-containing protein [Microbacterium sp. AZCO]|uniref:collagen-binding domain-containing protein n=1 Tax=Microbacterium sp. AZCO TaxID=3142976 RepID=UPI0031F34FCF